MIYKSYIKHLLCVLAFSAFFLNGVASAEFTNMRVEWQASCDGSIPQVPDKALDLSWDFTAPAGFTGDISSLCRITVLSGTEIVWDEQNMKCPADVIEYSGPALTVGNIYNWKVVKYDLNGNQEESSTCNFQVIQTEDLPKNREHIRLFKNFPPLSAIAYYEYDFSYSQDTEGVKNIDPDHRVLPYDLHTGTMTPYKGQKEQMILEYGEQLGTEKYETQFKKSLQLQEWWCTNHGACNIPDSWFCEDEMPGCEIPVEAEKMFLHFRNDLTIESLPLGVTGFYDETRTGQIKGWDPDNDLDGDGIISDTEWELRVNPDASARVMQQARVPAYYWGYFWEYLKSLEGIQDMVQHRSDFAMNLGSPDYRQFMYDYISNNLSADPYADGVYFDTSNGYWEIWHGWANYTDYAEYSNEGAYILDNTKLFKSIKESIEDNVTPGIPGDKIVAANGWHSDPHVIDATQWENWLNITMPYRGFNKQGEFLKNLDSVIAELKRGIILHIQFHPMYDASTFPFGEQAPVERERDQIYGLASYYLAAGDKSYFSYGMHPYYASSHNFFFGAIYVDIGEPEGDYYTFAYGEAQGNNQVINGDFEETVPGTDNPADWDVIAEPVEVVSGSDCMEGQCAKISATEAVNNINKQYVTLEQNTTYTLSGYIRTENVSGGRGANFYLYDFDGSDITECGTSLKGDNDWTYLYCTFTTGSDNNGRINFRLHDSTGTAWFDNIELRKGLSHAVLRRDYTKAVVMVRPPTNHDMMNLIDNGDFEKTVPGTDNPADWDVIAEPVEVVSGSDCMKGQCAKISATEAVNNINKQYVTLEQNTTYTLSGYIRTENVSGGRGANFYPYDFDGSDITECGTSLKGDNDWTYLYCTFTTGSDNNGRINFRLHDSTGTAWFDNIRLSRDFADASTYDLNNYYYPVHADGSLGTVVDSVTLRSGEAAILVKACTDGDGDGYAVEGAVCGEVDCNDNDAAVNPGHSEICNGIDDNCDGYTDEEFIDTDSDGIKDCVDPDDDNDGLTDGDEINIYETDPLNPDTDSDGLGDEEEIQAGTLPLHPDTDHDGVLDGQDGEPLNIFFPYPEGWKLSKNSDFSTSDSEFSTTDTFYIIVWSSFANAQPMKKAEYKIKNASGFVHKEDLADAGPSVFKGDEELSSFSTSAYTVEIWLRDNNNADYEVRDIPISVW